MIEDVFLAITLACLMLKLIYNPQEGERVYVQHACVSSFLQLVLSVYSPGIQFTAWRTWEKALLPPSPQSSSTCYKSLLQYPQELLYSCPILQDGDTGMRKQSLRPHRQGSPQLAGRDLEFHMERHRKFMHPTTTHIGPLLHQTSLSEGQAKRHCYMPWLCLDCSAQINCRAE